jgi:uncharacterized membrane protein YhfC
LDLNVNVSVVSIICMFISFILAVLLPLAIIIYFKVKNRLNLKAVLFGALLFVVFALILESIMHSLVLGSNPQQSFIFKSPVLYMLYGGFAAGIFEESARLIGFKFLLKVRKDESINTGLSYGFGHGGIEAIILGGLAVINNIVNSFLINSGMMDGILKGLPVDRLNAAHQAINTLVTQPSYIFLVSGFERVVALVIQVSLSLIVLKAVVDKKWIYFICAIVIHAMIDFPAVLYQTGILKSVYLVELFAVISAAICAAIVYKLYSGKKDLIKAEVES